MRFTLIAVVLCAVVWVNAGDVTHLKLAKARLAGKLLGKSRHHKRGVFGSVPTFKLGHDIPHVTHSFVKPLVITYPPTATVSAVKVPLDHPVLSRHPNHKVPSSHPHYALKYPYHTKTVVVPKPDHHFHHHHHYVPPKPVVPLVPVPATPVVPLAQPTSVVDRPIPAPSPSVVVHHAQAPTSLIHAQPLPIAPPPLHVLPPIIKPILPSAPIPIQPAPIFPAPTIPYASHYPYVIRPGNAVQTSYFATYPRYPLLNYQSPLIPLTAPAPAAPTPVFLERPHVPHFHLQGAHDGVVVEPHAPTVPIEPTPTLLHPVHGAVSQPGLHVQSTLPQHEIHLHGADPQAGVHLQNVLPQQDVHLHGAVSQNGVQLHSAQPSVPLDHDGWNPVSVQPHDLAAHHPEPHPLPQPHEVHHQFTQEQGNQVFEHHTGATDEQQYHDFQQQIQHHIQQQIEQAQYEQNLHNQHQLNQEYGTQDYHQQHVDQEYTHNGQEYAQHGQDYPQPSNEYGVPQQQQQLGQEYGLPQQLGHEYGLAQQGLEGRSNDNEGDTQLYHNHIPLGLQPPIDRPPEHFS